MKKFIAMLTVAAVLFGAALAFAADYRLNASERYALVNLLPQKGKMLEMLLVKDLAEKLRLTPAEITSYKEKIGLVELPNGSVGWDPEKVEAVEATINVDDNIIPTITDKLREMENKGEITITILSLYQKFIRKGDGEVR